MRKKRETERKGEWGGFANQISDFRKGPHEISAGTVFTVFKAITHINTVNTVLVEISRGPFRKSYRNSVCKTSLITAAENVIFREK